MVPSGFRASVGEIPAFVRFPLQTQHPTQQLLLSLRHLSWAVSRRNAVWKEFAQRIPAVGAAVDHQAAEALDTQQLLDGFNPGFPALLAGAEWIAADKQLHRRRMGGKATEGRYMNLGGAVWEV